MSGDVGQATVLLVEDDADFRDVVSLQLRAAGFQVLEAGDAGEAWRLVHAHAVDAVLTDLRLPGIDGRTLSLQLRWDFGQAIALIGFSALPLEDDVTHVFDAMHLKPDVQPVVDTLRGLLAAPSRGTIGRATAIENGSHHGLRLMDSNEPALDPGRLACSSAPNPAGLPNDVRRAARSAS